MITDIQFTNETVRQYDLQKIDGVVNGHNQISVSNVIVHARVLGECTTRCYRLNEWFWCGVLGRKPGLRIRAHGCLVDGWFLAQ